MCKIYIQFPDRSRFVASGTLIGNRYMQTSGQCVYNASHGGWAYSIEVVPGQYGNYRPYGSAWATIMRTYNGWIYNKDREYDLAVVTLDRNIGSSTGYLGYAYISNLNGYTGNMGAYDTDRYNGTDLLYRYGSLWGDEGTGIYYYMDTAAGSAGGGVYVIINGGRYVVASSGWQSSTWNFGTKINRQRFYDIQGWLASGN
jgi:glutamyl endopeptidase